MIKLLHTPTLTFLSLLLASLSGCGRIPYFKALEERMNDLTDHANQSIQAETKLNEGHRLQDVKLADHERRIKQLEQVGDSDSGASPPATTTDTRIRILQPGRSVVVQNCPEPASPPSGTPASSAGIGNAHEPADAERLATNVRFQCDLPEDVKRFIESSTDTLGKIDRKQDEVLTKQEQVLQRLNQAEQRIIAAIKSQQEPPPEPE